MVFQECLALCSHTNWKNIPKAWQGSFQDKDQTTIVMESICDYLWFWHASYGYAEFSIAEHPQPVSILTKLVMGKALPEWRLWRLFHTHDWERP
jgi:hypothetical protein